MKLFLGIDSSCYTSSCALVNDKLELVAQQRQLLPVVLGERGLRQSEAVFAHIRQFPGLLDRLMASASLGEIAGVCATARPVDDVESYMPVFRSGHSIGQSLAAVVKVPFYETTHQRGHLAAATIGCQKLPDEHLALHLSGGTTDLLHVDGDTLKTLGKSLDLHAGQLVDRIGVRMGLSFPAGPALEQLARYGKADGRYSAVLKGADCHLSGAETQAMRDLDDGEMNREDIAAEVYDLLTRMTLKMLMAGSKATGLQDMLIFGGIASSQLFRELLRERAARRSNTLRIWLGKPELSGDNAAGVAILGAKQHLGQQ